jgi:hypothetical protein
VTRLCFEGGADPALWRSAGVRIWLRRLVQQVELFTGLEADCLARSDGDFGAGARIAADAGFARLDGKDAEAAKFDAITGDKSLLHAFEDGVYRSLCFGSWQAGAFNNPLYKILLNHLGRRPWAVIFLKIDLTGFSKVIVETHADIVNARSLP